MIGVEVFFKIINWFDRLICVFFGDGVGAVILIVLSEEGILGFEFGSDGENGFLFYCYVFGFSDLSYF